MLPHPIEARRAIRAAYLAALPVVERWPHLTWTVGRLAGLLYRAREIEPGDAALGQVLLDAADAAEVVLHGTLAYQSAAVPLWALHGRWWGFMANATAAPWTRPESWYRAEAAAMQRHL